MMKNKLPTSLELEQELISIATDRKRTAGLASSLAEVSRVGGLIRERLSVDMTFLIGQLRDKVEVGRNTPFLEYPTMLTLWLELLAAFSGMESENVNRGVGWLFLGIGRRLERAIHLTRQLHEITKPLVEQDWPLLECFLEVGDRSMAYRSRYYTTLQPLPVLDDLMADETNPRFLNFQLVLLADLYQRLPRHLPGELQAMRATLVSLRGFDLRKLRYPLPGAAKAANGADGLSQLDQFLRGAGTTVAFLIK